MLRWLQEVQKQPHSSQILIQTPGISRYIRVRDFQNLVNERTREFVGREFVFKAIDNLLSDPSFYCGYIVITGEPGIGKTALLAQLVKQRGYVHHFNIASQNIRTARDFLNNVCAQLVVQYKLPYHTLPEGATRDSGFLSQLLVEVATKKETRPVVILVDALDEAESSSLYPGINCLYLPQALPEGVFFVVTTREKADYRLFVDQRKDIYLRDDDPYNLEDVRRYVLNFVRAHRDQMVSRIEQWNVEENVFTTIITEKSQGNFMYLVYVLRDIRDGKLTAINVDDIRKLPQGLREYYQRHWRSMKAQDVEQFEKYYQPVVCILATVREPVSIGQVAEWTKLSPVHVKEVVSEWREFLNVNETEQGESLYRVYHTSFQDFLKEEVGLVYYHDMIAQDAWEKLLT